MAELQIKQDITDMAQEAGTSAQNHWPITREGPTRRKAIPKKCPKKNSNTGSRLATRRPRVSSEGHRRDFSISLGYSGNGQDYSLEDGEFGGRWGARGGGQAKTNAIAKLQAELHLYKQENRELKKRLADALNIHDLETTLRMTLNSFGVPIPDNSSRFSCSCSLGFESPWQSQQELEQMSSTNDEDEDVQIVSEFEETLHRPTQSSRRRHARARQQQQQQQQPQPQSQYTSSLGQPDQNTSRSQQECPTVPQVSWVELVPSSGIFVDSTKLNSISFKKGWSYTLLTRSLMPMVFSKEEMIASCVRGERATGKGALTSPARPALDQIKVQAIITFVSSHFPDIQPYQITQTMNQKLVDVRGTIKKRKRARFARGDTLSA